MKKMKRRQKKQLAFLTVIVLIASVFAIMLLTPAFDIQKIEVYGNSVLKTEDIIRSSGITKGVNIFGVSLGEAKDNLKSMGYVESVKIKRSLPSTIRITIVEEVGVAYIKAEEGFVIITADGRCIDITDGAAKKGEDKASKGSVSLPDFPVIKGLKNVTYKLGETLGSEDEAQLESLFICLHEFSKYGYIFDMTQIDVSDTTDIKFYYKNKDLCVSVGTAEKVGYKMECFGPILAEIGENPKGYIDLERLTFRKTQEKETKEE